MVESNIQIAHEGKALSNNINVKLEKRDTIFAPMMIHALNNLIGILIIL